MGQVFDVTTNHGPEVQPILSITTNGGSEEEEHYTRQDLDFISDPVDELSDPEAGRMYRKSGLDGTTPRDSVDKNMRFLSFDAEADEGDVHEPQADR